jgi:ketosteroid isomerase-like protein
MDEHPNATIIRRMSESDDLGPLDFVTDDVVWHVLGRDEPYRGKSEMQRASGSADYEWVGEKTHDVLANDEHAVSLLEATARRGEKTFTFRTVEIYHMRDGKIAERWAFSDDTEAIKRFFA